MKKIYSYLVLGILLLSVSSCREDYLETVPTDTISSESIVETADNMMLSINGMHRSMYTRQNRNQGQSGQSGIMIMLDALGEDVVFTTTGNGWFVSTVRWLDQQNENSSNMLYPWRFYYMLIRNANVLINGGQNASGSEVVKRNALGQAYAFRAFSHFQLVQLYASRYDGTPNAKGIPLRLEANDDPLARSSVEEVYKQINLDLDKSLELLTGVTRVHKSHFDVNVVRGLKARVAMVLGNYEVAAEQARLARQGYALMDNGTYLSGFNKLDNNEWIWGSQIREDQTALFANFGAFMSRNFNSTNIRQNPKAMNTLLYRKFPKTDVRTQVVDETGAHVGLGLARNFSKYPYTSQKFLSVSSGDSRMDVPYMRAAEMYLIEAEALARAGREVESKVVFTEFSKNRNPQYVETASVGAAYITEILDSRRIELWGEGFRFLDLKRLNMPLDRNGANHSSVVINNIFDVPAGDSKWTFLIPRRELNSNTLLEQN
ncbi:RagB/SusD family nutrient uptake outer membrane protein [Bergeyella sp. RCAD1439]|uniref:RagB/SusD family nutrient uptake outer membrane protein n=1 Tax=Bergeyella anatis TaxID=3113737 RepID=UPI002E18476C|nr:RagB/SusD family nutrient uptake outer membrane protein [Bergeyella sp. RCAD1439]